MTEPTFDHLSDREILILTCKQTFTNSKVIEAHSEKIRSLELWKNWTTGAFAALLALIGIRSH